MKHMSNKSESNRIEYLDLAKGIGIILVIMGHTGFLFDNLKTYFFSFHMPLFFIISGMLMYIKGEGDKKLKTLAIKKTKSLMIPYFWFSIVYIIVYIITYNMGLVTKEDFAQSIVYMFTLYGDSTLWFLPALLIGELLFIFLVKKIEGEWSLAIALCLAGVAYLLQLLITPIWAKYNDSLLIVNLVDFIRVFMRGMIASLFVGIGYFGYKYLVILEDKVADKLLNINSNKTKKQAYKEDIIKEYKGIYIALGVILLAIAYGFSMINETVDFHRLVFGDVMWFMAAAVLGSFGVVFISKGLDKIKPINFWGKNSLIIMCTHLNCYVLYAAIQIAWLVDTVVTRAKSYVFMCVIVIAVLVMETLIILLINNVLPFMVGKKRHV